MKCCRIIFLLTLLMLVNTISFAVNIRDVVYNTKNSGKVVFSHSQHINKKEMSRNCRACHDAIFDLKKKKHYTMADMKRGKSCGACHDGKMAFSIAKCADCHQTREITYNVKATGPTRFSHKSHLVKSANCDICHPAVFVAGPNRHVTMAAMEKGASCGACHNSKQAFSVKECSKCHPVRELQFEEKSTGNVVFSHAFHTGLYTCTDCHTSLFKTSRSNVLVSMQEMEKGISCGHCHDAKTAFSVKEKCEACHKM
jgi:c(7)-type cytochrome triheme protein